MKRVVALVILFLVFALVRARAQQNPDDQYVVIYSLMQQADSLVNSGQPREALAQYRVVQNDLEQFQKGYPDWNPKIVNFRLNYLAEKIAELSALISTTPAPAHTTAMTNAASTASDLQAQLDALRAQVQNLQADNATLQAKLKEALSVQPAAVSPDELAKAQEQVRSLQKENDLLRASLAQNKTNAVAAPVSPATAPLQSALADAKQNLARQTERVNQLALENQSLQARLQMLLTNADSLEALRQENALLKKRAAELQSAADVNWLEKTALENRLRQWQAAATNGASAQADEINTLRARLAADEVQAIPYTPEELALFRQSAPPPENSPASQDSGGELPPDAAALAAEAQNYFSAREFDKAEADYQKILQRDESNGLALANLAAIQLEQGKLADAEKNIRAALAQRPDDAYNLTILGRLKFSQGKYDEALDALSRAAKLDPQNPEIRNYLGVTLAQKGLRAQAETALRKAVQLNPNYGDAHNNLAVIYLNQQPPLVELARWHYEKALAAGQPRNPALEKELAAKGAPVDAP